MERVVAQSSVTRRTWQGPGVAGARQVGLSRSRCRHAANLNAYAERRSVKEECLSKAILFGERSLRRALSVRAMISGIKALAFDTGGTILDWHRGISVALAAAGQRRGIVADWAAATNEYRRRALTGMTRQVRPDFNIDDLHRRVLDELAGEFGWSTFTAEDRSAIQHAWHALDAWPDFPAALARLRPRYVVASFTILSTSLIVDVSRKNGLNWDCVVSCEMIGSYKPNPDAYITCAKWLGYRPEEIVMVACHNFDLLAARKTGYRSAFVRRPDPVSTMSQW